MLYTESSLAWLENLKRQGPATSELFAGGTSTNSETLRPGVNAGASIERDDELHKRLGQVVFSTLCEKLGRANTLPFGEDLEAEALTAAHLRAARALLGWSMSDLASKSNLSISTIKRLEQETTTVTAASYRIAVNALRVGGIRFVMLQDGTIALAGPET